MRYWLIAIKNSIPPKWVVVLAPFGALVVAFFIWFLFGGLFFQPPSAKQLRHQAELEQLQPRTLQGDHKAQYRVGVILRDGLAGEKNSAEAAKLFQTAAKKGHIKSQYALGKLFADGTGGRQDFVAAAKWFRAAAGFGRHREAQFELANLYFSGRGVGHDYTAAVEWFRRAAMRGHAGAQFVMASMFEKGWGVNRDLAEAFAWYALAAKHPSRVRRDQPEADPAGEFKRMTERLSRLHLKRGKERLRVLNRAIKKTVQK